MSIYNSSIKLPVIVSSYPAVVLILDFATTQKLNFVEKNNNLSLEGTFHSSKFAFKWFSGFREEKTE
jgi:hypothetical protein